jgi:hypothetical protein
MKIQSFTIGQKCIESGTQVFVFVHSKPGTLREIRIFFKKTAVTCITFVFREK